MNTRAMIFMIIGDGLQMRQAVRRGRSTCLAGAIGANGSGDG